MIRVALADDHTLVRQGIKSLLALVEDVTLAFEASDGEEAVRMSIAERPDVLLLDMRMPKGDGLHVLRTLHAQNALPATLVLTTFDDEGVALQAVRAGARGFLLKDVTLERLVHAVRTLARGGSLIQPGLTERVQRTLGSERATPLVPDTTLTDREREVLRLLAAGYSNREIAHALFVAEGTVKNHVSNILAKMGVRDRTRAVLKAVEHGFL